MFHFILKLVGLSLNKFDLLRYKDSIVDTLSGGNKRKLSTAIALLDNPEIVFLVLVYNSL